jgi:hypothetical protein
VRRKWGWWTTPERRRIRVGISSLGLVLFFGGGKTFDALTLPAILTEGPGCVAILVASFGERASRRRSTGARVDLLRESGGASGLASAARGPRRSAFGGILSVLADTPNGFADSWGHRRRGGIAPVVTQIGELLDCGR